MTMVCLVMTNRATRVQGAYLLPGRASDAVTQAHTNTASSMAAADDASCLFAMQMHENMQRCCATKQLALVCRWPVQRPS